MIETVSHYQSAAGVRVARREFSPGDDVEVRGGAVLLHGLGEHTARYAEVMRGLTGRGYLCAGVDWPGHGESPGLRGHIDSLDVVRALVTETLDHVRERTCESAARRPPVLVGHSMGALLALDFLAHRPDAFRRAWVNAPPLDPSRGRSRAYVAGARRLEALLPRLTVSNGITPSMCFDTTDPEFVRRAREDCHQRVSLRLGVMLIDAAAAIRRAPDAFADPLELLVTQGGADPVCPPEVTREWFDALRLRHKTYREYPGLLHECWRQETVAREAIAWLTAERDPEPPGTPAR